MPKLSQKLNDLEITNVPNRSRLLRTDGNKDVVHMFSTDDKNIKFPFKYWNPTDRVSIFQLTGSFVGYNHDRKLVVKISNQQFAKANPHILAPKPIGRPKTVSDIIQGTRKEIASVLGLPDSKVSKLVAGMTPVGETPTHAKIFKFDRKQVSQLELA